MAQQSEQQRQRQRGRSQEYERDYSDEDLGMSNTRNYNESMNREEYNPPGGGRGYARGDYDQAGSNEGWGEQANPWRGRGYARGYSGQEYSNEYPNREDYNPPGGGRGYARGDYGQTGGDEAWREQSDAWRGRGYARGDYGQEYGRNRNVWNEGYSREGMNTMARTREYPGQRDYAEPLHNRPGEGGPMTSWWMTPGPHLGKGPQGWSRSKERIMEDICERMAQHGYLDASNVQVDVNNGQVTLTGQVNSRREKRIAEDIAESVWGVNDVNNQLRVAEGMGTEQHSAMDRNK